MRREGNYLVLTSGRRLYVFAGVLGLLDNEGGAADHLVYGYDGHVDNTHEVPTLTPEEREDIAEYMIQRWAKWADLVATTTGGWHNETCPYTGPAGNVCGGKMRWMGPPYQHMVLCVLCGYQSSVPVRIRAPLSKGHRCVHIGCGGYVRPGDGTCTWCGRA